MKKTTRTFDLIVFGATAFTGRLATEYLASRTSLPLNWGMAGRTASKLDAQFDALKGSFCPPSAKWVVDHQDFEAVREIVATAKVVINFAGPFGRYGESVIAACAVSGTHYLDITGETLWVRAMLEKYQDSARKTGAILIPFSGFDSIPSDLGVWKVQKLAREKSPTQEVDRIFSLFSVKGGLNGGTFQTVLDMLKLDEAQRRILFDPANLVPQEQKSKFRFQETTRPVTIPGMNVTAPPFFMATINNRVVNRSQALRLKGGERPFEYIELLKLPSAFSKPASWAIYGFSEVFQKVGRLPVAQKLLERFGPKAGVGPSKSLQDSGFFKARFFAHAGTELLASWELSYRGDPGNKATVLMVCESAFALVFQFDALPQTEGGFWTPSTALGDVLLKRLVDAGMKVRSDA